MDAKKILQNNNLKRTSCREGIINVVMSANHALSENEIRERLPGNYDRTTFYRSFKTLEQHNIIHRIVVDNQLVRYAIDNSINRKDEHIHFYCNKCNIVKCIDVSIQKYSLPEGYKQAETEVVIKGICSDCN
jgi:Fur family ferric uptake transcriptional regulator